MGSTPPADSLRLPIARHGRYRGFLAPEEQAALLDWALANQARFAPAGVRNGKLNPGVRTARVLRDLKPLRPMLKRRLLDLLPRILADLGMPAFEPSRVELELAAHGEGDRFKLHTDTYTGDERPERGDRMVSAVYYFHREPKRFGGGELWLHRFDAMASAPRDFVAIEPEQNSLVAFPSWAPHEVRPVSCPSQSFADSRLSVNVWIYRPRGAA